MEEPQHQFDDSAESTGRRTTAQVLRDHLELRSKGELETDLERNFHPDLVLLHVNGVERGYAGVRRSWGRLKEQLPSMRFEIVSTQVYGDYAYLEWQARSDHHTVSDGADSFVIRDGKIVMQSIHYTLREPD